MGEVVSIEETSPIQQDMKAAIPIRPAMQLQEDTFDLGVAFCVKAEQAEKHDRQKANDLYVQGLDLIVPSIKTESKHVVKSQKKSICRKYMARAEANKKKMSTQLNSSISNNTSNNKTIKKPIVQQANIDPEIRRAIESEILIDDSTHPVTFKDVAGLDSAKEALYEMVILPALRPDVFQGLRQPPKGLLLYGPPGTGKTFIARAVANESRATFFAISASTLVSKYHGDGERLVRALFAVARERAPSIIFIDEIDSIISKRSSNEHEASRRLKTQLLVELDGVHGHDTSNRVCFIGATNCPEDLDGALIRRLSRRIYIGLPTAEVRKIMFDMLLQKQRKNISTQDMKRIIQQTEGYSASDIRNLAADASMGPVRDAGTNLLNIPVEKLNPISLRHFQDSMKRIRPSVTKTMLEGYSQWDREQNDRW